MAGDLDSAAARESGCLSDDLIAQFLAGLSSPEQLAALDAHVGACDGCFTLLAASAGLCRGAFDLEPASAEVSGIYERALPCRVAEARVGSSTAREPHESIARRFEVTGFIASGATSDVYRGRDRRDGRIVAVKRLRREVARTKPKALLSFALEAELLSRLEHPNVARLIEYVPGTDDHELVLRHADRTLRDVLRAEPGGLPLERVLEIALGLCDGLARVHDLEIVHRDLKPENILIAEDGTPLLADFGLACAATEQPPGAGELVGTPAYMSPEAAQRLPVDARADLWALGILLFEMLSGGRPFHAADPRTVLSAILKDPVPLTRLPSHSPPALTDLIVVLLQKDRERRIPTARQLGARLEELSIRFRKSVPRPIRETSVRLRGVSSCPTPSGGQSQ